MKQFTSSILLIISFITYGQEDLIQDNRARYFYHLLATYDIRYIIPNDFIEIDLPDEPNIDIKYAIKNLNRNFEVWFYIKDIKHNKVDSTSTDLSNNLANIIKLLMNNSDSVIPDIHKFPESFNQRFDSDWGASSTFKLANSMKEPYKLCHTIYLGKNNSCEIALFILSEDIKKDNDLVVATYNSIRFMRIQKQSIKELYPDYEIEDFHIGNNNAVLTIRKNNKEISEYSVKVVDLLGNIFIDEKSSKDLIDYELKYNSTYYVIIKYEGKSIRKMIEL